MRSLRAALCTLTVALAEACGDDARPPGDHAPTIDDVSVTTPEDTAVTVTIPADDADGDPVAIDVEAPADGALTVDGLAVTYTPAGDFVGAEALTVTATAGGRTATAVLEIIVTPVDDPPDAVDDVRPAVEDQAQSIPVAALLANDVDPDGDALTVTAVGGAIGGAVVLDGDTVVFTPSAALSGDATFTYTASDGALTDTATVTLQFGADNDAPVAVDDAVSTDEDVALAIPGATLVANDTDAEGQPLVVTAVGDATGGAVALAAGTVTFTPDADASGTASFQYTVSDGALTDTGLVTVTVDAVNDAPVAVDDTAATSEDVPVVINGASLVADDTDIDGGPLGVTAVAGATNGTAVLAAGSVTFTPSADFHGSASFQYTVSDGAGGTDTGLVTVTVAPVNDAPVAVDDTAATNEDIPVVISGASLVADDTDVDGGALSVTAVAGATNGTAALAAGNVTFTPGANFSGSASFQYTVSDGAGGTDTGLVTVTVHAVNDAPIAVDDAAATEQGVAVAIPAATLVANDTDVDGGALTVTAVGSPVNGTVNLASGTVTFTPTTGFTGAASFQYTVGDGAGGTDTGLVTVTVSAAGTILALVGGNSHICALLNSGGVKCWGLNAYGNLGLGDVNSRGNEPNEMGPNLPFVQLGTGRTAVALAAGGEHTCALLDDSTVKCWGYNSAGQLGLGDGSSRGNAPGQMGDNLPALSLGTGRTAVQLDGGSEHTCAVLDNGQVKCWGANGSGQLGLGDTATRGDAPGEMGDALPAVDLGPGRTAIQVSAGASHTCALLDDLTTKCWGSNFRGQLGLGDTADRGDAPGEMGSALPVVDLGPGLSAVELALGEIHSCARLSNDQIKCWGYGSFGALGLGDAGDRGGGPGEMGANLPAASLGAGRHAIGLAVGHHTCALLDNLAVKCWGYGSFGQLGQGNQDWIGTGPGQMGDNLPPVALGAGVVADAISSMLYDSCVLTSNDLIKCWGGNLNGQLGQGDNVYRGDGPGEMGDALPFISIL